MPKVFIRFAPMRKVETRRFERNWTTFVNPAFCAAWKSPSKMVVWNRPSRFRTQRCLFPSPQWGKSKQGALNAIGRPSSTRLFALLGKAHAKCWYETDLVYFDSKGVYSLRPDGESPNKAFWTHFGRPSSTRLFALLGKAHPKRWYETDLEELDPKGVYSLRPDGESRKKAFWTHFGRPSSTRLFGLLGKAHPKWCYETDLVQSDPKGVYSLRPDGESRNKAFWTQLDDLRQPGFLRCLEKPTQNAGMKTTWWNSILRVFISFAPMGKVETRRFKRNWKTFVNPAFCAAW